MKNEVGLPLAAYTGRPGLTRLLNTAVLYCLYMSQKVATTSKVT